MLDGLRRTRVSPKPGWQAVGEALRASGYFDRAIADLLGAPPYMVTTPQLPLLRRRVPHDETALHVLVRLLLLGESVPRRVAERSLGTTFRLLTEVGIVASADRSASGNRQITPIGDLLLLHDRDLGAAGRRDDVLGIQPSTISVANATFRRSVAESWDLGTGSGFHALLAARHSGRVVATDRHVPSLRVASINATLNGLGNICVIEADWFDARAMQASDLIVGNLPFTMSPQQESVFEHPSGGLGDDLTARILSEASQRLEPGGHGVFLCSWTVDRPQEWHTPVSSILNSAGCDALIIQHALEGTLEYSVARARRIADYNAREFEARVEQWEAAFASRGIHSIATGLVVMRKRMDTATPWTSRFVAAHAPRRLASEALERAVRGSELLHRCRTNDDLLEARLVPAATLEVVPQPHSLRGSSRAYDLAVPEEAGLLVTVSDRTLVLVRAADGRSLRELLLTIGDDHEVLADIRALVSAGHLVAAREL